MNGIVLDTKQTIENFLEGIKNKVNNNAYSSKEVLLQEINDFKISLMQLPKKEEITLQNFDTEILEILQTFDQKNKNTPIEKTDNYSEFERENEAKGATINTNGQQYTIKQRQEAEKTVWEEMKDMYNQTVVNQLDAPLSPPQDTIENNFALLKRYTHEEIHMQNNINPNERVFSVETKALQYYSAKNNITLAFSNDGLARDKEGTMYEATINMTGEVTITKTKSTTIIEGIPQIESKIELETISTREIVAFEKAKPKENQTINFAFLDYLKEHLENDGYKEALYSANTGFSQEEIDMYEDLLKEEKEEKRRDEIMMQKKAEGKEKVYVLNPPKEGRNGFVNALLLSIITILFGGLCLTYFLMGILA